MLVTLPAIPSATKALVRRLSNPYVFAGLFTLCYWVILWCSPPKANMYRSEHHQHGPPPDQGLLTGLQRAFVAGFSICCECGDPCVGRRNYSSSCPPPYSTRTSTSSPCAQTLADFLPVATSVTMNRLAARPTTTLTARRAGKPRRQQTPTCGRRSTDTTRRTRRPRGTFGTPY
ncbi:hypothetical protein B0H13DRAFT_2658400 [Mycena leptocephala]|nr:hypothetical protein B0H13DRAFT_2658400 [Mycena leptocephala]